MKKKIIILLLLGVFFSIPLESNGSTIKALKIIGPIPTDPTAPFWSENGSDVIVDMERQMVTNPMWPEPSVKFTKIKAITNGNEIAIRLEWNDSSRDDIFVKSKKYKDQAAIMFPVNQSGEEPPFTMGGDGERVNIWQWKAFWRKDENKNVKTSSLNGKGDKACESYAKSFCDKKVLTNEEMKNFSTCISNEKVNKVINKEPFGSYKTIICPEIACFLFKNSDSLSSETFDYLTDCLTAKINDENKGISVRRNKTPNEDKRYAKNDFVVSEAEDLNAEGFSTLTSQAHQDVMAKGKWSNNRWVVVYKRTLNTGDSNDTQFTGGKTPIAIAIWDGSNKERSAQKAITQWHTLNY
jgi:DMSO reductase family type II enzyme heme b subunit